MKLPQEIDSAFPKKSDQARNSACIAKSKADAHLATIHNT
jgi:hypothetical protein